jgi:hypothetical protein
LEFCGRAIEVNTWPCGLDRARETEPWEEKRHGQNP